MSFDYINKMGALTPDQRLHFYELLAHNLTICIRGIWSEPDLTDSEKLDRIYWINEILHRVTAKIYTLRLQLHDWTESDSWKMIQGYIAQKGAMEKDVLFAIDRSYIVVTRKSNESSDDPRDA